MPRVQKFKALIGGVLVIRLLGSVCPAVSFADDEPPTAPTPPGKPWTTSTEAGVVSTNGNSKSTTTNAKEDFTYKWTKTSLELVGGGLGSSSGNAVTSEQYFAHEKMTYPVADRNYLYEKYGWNKDRFAKINNRWDGTGGVGRKLLDFTEDKLDGELGAGFTSEERIDAPHNSYASGRVAMKYIHTFTKTSNFSQNVEFLPNFKSSNGFRLNTESAITAAIATHLSLKTSFIWNRVNAPPPDTGKDDTRVIAALVASY